jgi:hypothetical protein
MLKKLHTFGRDFQEFHPVKVIAEDFCLLFPWHVKEYHIAR